MEEKSVRAGFGVMLLKEGKVLLGKRNDDLEKADSEFKEHGCWTMPGGKLKYGESFEEGASREVMEETGIKLGKVKVIGVNNDMNEHAHFVTVALLSEDFDGEPKIMEPDEITEWKWFDLNKIPENIYFPSKKVLDFYKEKLSSGTKLHMVAVTGIVVKDGKYLITQRSLDRKSFPGKWTVPGGSLEINDYKNLPKDTSEHWYNVLENVLRREVREETGLEIKNLKYLTSMTFIRKDDLPFLVISMYCDYEKGDVVLDSESVNYAWVNLEEAKNYDLIEGIYEELEMLDHLLKGERVGEWGDLNNESIVEKVRRFVEGECKKPTSKYGYDIYSCHFTQVYDYAVMLAKKLGTKQEIDMEVVELAAWLHDIGTIVYGREDHHLTGMEIAEERLRELGYDENRIEKIKHCIFAHRGSTDISRETIEAQIIADADAMSAFDNIGGQFKATFIYDNMSQMDSRKYVRRKLVNSYNKLSDEAKEMIKPKFDAAMLLLQERKDE